MKGLLTKDFLTLKKKYGIVRVIIDLAIIITLMIVLESAAPIYICFLLLPLEITSMIISLTTCDEEWRWDKFAISLPITKTSIVKSRYLLSGILSFIGLIISILVNTISYFCFPKYKYGFYSFCFICCYTLIFSLYITINLFFRSQCRICHYDSITSNTLSIRILVQIN